MLLFYNINIYLYVETHHKGILMRLGGSDRPRYLRPSGAANLSLLTVTDPGLEAGLQTGVLGCALDKGLKTLVLQEEVWTLMGGAALEGGRALP